MFVNPYLHFRGNAGDAFHFYEKSLGGKELMVMTYGDAPGAEKTSPEMKGKVMHAQLKVGDSMLMGADAPEHKEPQGFSISFQTENPDEARRVFHALADGGKVTMPIDKTFFSPAFGMLTDKFGISWMVNTQQPR